jgi:rubrerythrin
MVSIAEKHHEARYLAFAANIEKSEVFKKKASIKWRCRNCGYVYEGLEALEECPACLHAKSYMEQMAQNY